MSEVQIAIIDQENTQIALAVPGVQGPAGAISSGGSANQVFHKVSGTNYDAGWTFIGNANVDAAAAIAGTKISPNFGSQTVATTGVFSHALGSQGAPTITFTGDTNTGIYSPGADQVAISTGGSGRLFIDANGNVGLGTSSPTNFANYQTLAFSDTTGSFIDFKVNGTGTHAIVADSSQFLIKSISGLPVTFGTNDTERLRITSAGLVGVGTSSPGQALTVNGNIETQNAGYVRSIGTGSDSAGVGPNIGVNSSSAIYYIQQLNASNGLDFWYYNAGWNKRLTLDSSGRLGIGTSSPVLPLHVEATTDGPQTLAYLVNASTGGTNETAALAFALKGTAGTGVCRINAGKDSDFSTNPNIDSYLAFTTTLNDTESERLRITSAGNVGIGTTAPAQKLEVQDGSISVGSSVNASTANVLLAGYGYILSGTKYGNTSIRSTYSNSDNSASLEFYVASGSTSTNERMRLDTLGRLLVGTSSGRGVGGSLQALTQIETTNYVAYSAVNNTNDTGGSALMFGKSRGTAVGSNTIVQNGDNLGDIYFAGADGTDLESIAARITCTVDGTPGNDDMPGRLVFSTTADGGSSPTERMRINSAGQTRILGGSAPLTVRTTLAAGTSDYLFLGYRSATNISDGVDVIDIFTNGNIVNTNNSYGAISDAKLKENIADSGSQWSDLKRLKVRKYNFKEETGRDVHTQIGLVAQEVELVSPGLVTESPDRDAEGNDLGTVTKSVNYSVLYMKAVKALQEAMERIETLEAKVAALESA